MPKPKGKQLDLATTLATATADTSISTGTTYVLVDSMTITPVAGRYLVWFNGSIHHGSNNGTIFTSIFAGGVQNTPSEREFMRGAGQGDIHASFTSIAEVTVNGSQAIEGRWLRAGGTLTMHERVLMILRVGD